MKEPVICILGNSVPLLIQPLRQNNDEKTYGEHLRDMEYFVVNGSKQAVMVSDIFRYMEDECIRYFPDYIILHFGIVECTYRARTRWLHKYFSLNAWNNSIIKKGGVQLLGRGLTLVVKKIYKIVIERPFFALGLKYRWLGPKKFQFVLKDVIRRFFADTPVKKIVLIGMLPVSNWVEAKAPGTQKSISQYNAIMSEIAGEYSNIIFLDTNKLAKNSQKTMSSPDGIHFTAFGHQLLAETIAKLLIGERDQFNDWQKINQYKHFHIYKLYENWYKRKIAGSK